MTQEDKELLLQDLCCRLPYGVKVQIDFGKDCLKYDIPRYVNDIVLCIYPEQYEVGVNDKDQACDIKDIKPYLRPISSMTEDEVDSMLDEDLTFSFAKWELPNYKVLDFLNSHHFDYRGLIEKGLALEAPEGMYNIK